MLRKNLHFILVFSLICITTAFWGGCVKEYAVEEFARPNALVRFINASPDAANATIQVMDRDSVSVVVNTTVAFGNASAYFTVPAGNRIITVTSGSTKKTYTVTIASDLQESIVLRNPVASMTLTPIRERYTYNDEAAKLASGICQVKFLNDVYNGPSVYFKSGPDSTGAIANLASSTMNCTAGKSYTFSVMNNTTKKEIGKCPALSGTTNTRYTIVVCGNSDATGVKSFTATVLTDDK